MRIAVIGAGGVGGFLGALLARGGHEVTFLARGEHLVAINARGLELRSKQFGDFTVRAPATDKPSELGQNALVLIAVKMYDFEEAARIAGQALAPDGLALTIQNGLDAPFELANVVGEERVLAGTASIEATILDPGVIGHLVPLHSVSVAELHGVPTARLERLVGELAAAGINAAVAQDARQALWDKACGLIPFATITAAANCTLGDFMGQPAARRVIDDLLDEAQAVSAATGVDTSRAVAGWRAFLEKGITQAPAFTSSMNRDLQAGRRIEVEWLTGKIVRLAEEHGVAAPVHRTLYGAIKMLEARRAA